MGELAKLQGVEILPFLAVVYVYTNTGLWQDPERTHTQKTHALKYQGTEANLSLKGCEAVVNFQGTTEGFVLKRHSACKWIIGCFRTLVRNTQVLFRH